MHTHIYSQSVSHLFLDLPGAPRLQSCPLKLGPHLEVFHFSLQFVDLKLSPKFHLISLFILDIFNNKIDISQSNSELHLPPPPHPQECQLAHQSLFYLFSEVVLGVKR